MKAIREVTRFVGRLMDSWYSVAIIAVLVGMLIYQNRHHAPAVSKGAPQFVEVGARIPDLHVLDIGSGRDVAVEWNADSRPSVVYLFQPNCAWCKRNLAGEKALAQLPGYRFLALSITDSGLKEYAAENKFPFPLYSAKDRKGIEALKPVATPMTIVIGHDGKVQAVFPGAYTARSAPAMEKVFGLKLPLASTPEASALTPAPGF